MVTMAKKKTKPTDTEEVYLSAVRLGEKTNGRSITLAAWTQNHPCLKVPAVR